jgi:hypothetical protein
MPSDSVSFLSPISSPSYFSMSCPEPMRLQTYSAPLLSSSVHLEPLLLDDIRRVTFITSALTKRLKGFTRSLIAWDTHS